MEGFDASNQFGWIASAPAWIETVENDANRTHLLDPIMLELCGDVSGHTVVDVGCGEGRFCRMLAARGADCIGLDPIKSMLSHGLALGSSKLVRASGEALPISSKVADLVVSYLSLIDIPDFRRAIAEMARILRPRGRLVMANIHPMASTIPGWAKSETGEHLYRRVDRYFDETGEVAAWDGVEILNWHRPLEAYMEAFLASGLKLERFVEPCPTAEQIQDRPSLTHETRAPNFIAMVWSKP